MTTGFVVIESVAQRILLIRGQKVMLDADLSELFGVPTKVSSHDQAIAGLIDAIRQLMMPAAGKSRPIGFTANIGAKRD